MKKIIFALLIVLLTNGPVLALPNLQLDISGGTYNNASETIVAADNVFTLYALMQDSKKTTLNQTYYLSAALFPKNNLTAESGVDGGSFLFNGKQIDVTSGMVFGIPPLETAFDKDPGDLCKHDIFETYFTEFAFTFNEEMKVAAYNTAEVELVSGELYRQEFKVDLTNLKDGYGIHFDLYSEQVRSGDIDVDQFAPFSHDAEGSHKNPPPAVPEPSTLILLGFGLLGLVVHGKRSLNY